MKKTLLFLSLLLGIALQSWAYDFSAVAPSGQILYYNISSGSAAYVTYQSGDSGEPSYSNLVGTLTIPSTVTYNGTTYSVTSIGYSAFRNCSGLTSVNIPNSVTDIGFSAFRGCTGLTSLTIPNSVTSIFSNAFYGCTGLTSVTIPNSVTDIGDDAFYNCTGLCNLEVPSSVTGIGDSAFYRVKNVSYNGNYLFRSPWGANCINGYVDGYFTYKDATRTYLTGCCTSVEGDITIPSTVDTIGGSAFSDCTGLTSVTIPNSVPYIGGSAFYNCTGLTSVTIPNSVTSIGSGAFSGCSGLTTVNFNATNCTTMGSVGSTAFDGCTSLVTLNIGDNVQTIPGSALAGCTGLTSVTIPNSVTSIGSSAFSGCSGLTSLTIPNSVTSIGTVAFSGCTGLTSVTIPNSVTDIGNNAFYGCTGLTTVNFNATNCYCSSKPFPGCTSLSTLNIGDNVQTIPSHVFSGCTGLTSLTIPNSVTSIGDYSFLGCFGLSSLTIGNSVTSIGVHAFSGCPGLTEIHSLNNVAPLLEESFESYNDYYVGANYEAVPSTIPAYIPCGSLASYMSRWSYFSNFIEDEAFTFSAVSADNNMGTVQIFTMPTCTSPQAVIYASANSGYRFDHWSDNNTSNPRSLTVTEDTELLAYFVPDGANPPVSNAPAIACVGLDQSGHNVVRWERNPASNAIRYNIYREGLGGYSIVGYVLNTGAADYSWVDDNSNTATQAYSYKLSEVAANGTESDLSQPHTTIHLQISQGQGSTWNLSWTPYVGFNYSGYRIFRGTTASSMSLLTELSSSATTYSDNNAPSGDVYYQIEVAASNGAKSITASSRSNIATSVQNQQFTVTVLSDNTSMGTVSGGGTFAQGATTTISATPLSGYTFTQWSDGSTQAQRTITVMGDATYTAFFTAGGSQPQQYLITVNSIDETMGTVTGGGLFDEGTITTIMATAKPGYQFVQWQDGNTQDIRTITVTADATYTAYFRADGTQGIDDVSAEDVKVFARGMEIVVEGCEGDEALVYDVTGRVMHRGRVEGPIHVGAMGVYLVKVGERQPRKVVVR